MDEIDYHLARFRNTAVGVGIILADGGVEDDSAIFVSPSRLRECLSNPELTMSIKKRFSGQRHRRVRFIVETLVYMCLSTRGYSVNHTVVRGVDLEHMLYVWEFIQTSSVSSTPTLRRMLARLCDGRSREGYEALFSGAPGSRLGNVSIGEYAEDAEWDHVDVEEHRDVSSFEMAAFVDRVLVMRLQPENSNRSVESLCIDALHAM